MRKRLTSIGLLAVVLGLLSVPPTVHADRSAPPRRPTNFPNLASGIVSGFADFQAAVFRSGKTVSTSTTSWRAIPNLGLTFKDSGSCLVNEVSATVSVGVKGGPVGMRVAINGRRLLPPGEIRFNPRSGNPSFNYTFAGNLGKDPVQPGFGLEWRSPTGRKVTLVRGAMNVLVQLKKCG